MSTYVDEILWKLERNLPREGKRPCQGPTANYRFKHLAKTKLMLLTQMRGLVGSAASEPFPLLVFPTLCLKDWQWNLPLDATNLDPSQAFYLSGTNLVLGNRFSKDPVCPRVLSISSYYSQLCTQHSCSPFWSQELRTKYMVLSFSILPSQQFSG